MIETTSAPDVRTDGVWLRWGLAGIGLAIIGLLMLGLTLFVGSVSSGGSFTGSADYILTAAALPLGIGLFVLTFAVHRLQRGRDGRLATAGLWIVGVCMAELLVQCAASLLAGAELLWGPLYPLACLGLVVGLALFAAGSWRVGLVPKWMLVVWPPLAVLGSFLTGGPLPLVLAVFLVLLGMVLARRVPLASS